jgi:hypothetical protein
MAVDEYQQLGGSGGGEPSVQLHEAVQRLVGCGLLSDPHRSGEVYHSSTKGRDAARQIRERMHRGERPDYGPMERMMQDLLRKMREDFGQHPVIREMILLGRLVVRQRTVERAAERLGQRSAYGRRWLP